MALTHQKFRQQAAEAKAFANAAKTLAQSAARLLQHHTSLGYAVAGDESKPAWITEDVAGNIDGFDFARQDYASIAYFADQFLRMLGNQAVSTGNYRDTVEKVADA